MLRKFLLHKTLLSVGVTLGLTLALALGVHAQATEEPEAAESATTQLPAATAAISQTVPITLQVTIPGPTGVITLDVPIFLTLDIRISLSQTLTPTLVVTPSVTLTEPVTEIVTEPVVTPEPTPTPTPSPAPTVAPTATPVVLPTPTPTPQPAVVEPICPDPRAVLTRPGVNQTVSGVLEIVGTASHRDFEYYKLEYAPGADIDPTGNYAFLADGRSPVIEGTLAAVDSTALANGVYTLKLTVVDVTGNFPPPCTVTFSIEN
jgi:hypothetical protein